MASFAGRANHDLRAPLRAISGLSQILVEDHQDLLDESGVDYLQRIAAAAKRVATCPAHSTVWLLFWLMQDFRLPFIVRRWVYLEGGG